jgi:glycosyltransferase involved in cell wall biosynthesis
LISALVGHGCEVHALAPDIDEELAEQVRRLGATPRSVTLTNSGLNPISNIATLRGLIQQFRTLRPDCVISYTIKPVTLGSIAARRAGVPRIVALVTGLGYAFGPGNEWRRRISRAVGKLLYRRALNTCNLAIFQNPDDEADFRRLGLLPKRLPTVQVRGSGVDVERFHPVPLKTGPCFLMLARLLGDKGVREYAKAARFLLETSPDARFILAGDKATVPDAITQGELDEMIAGGIEYLGALNDVRPAIADSNVFVLPSYREGTPRSVLEAMAMGRPIVTCDVPGCRETVVEGVNGYLVPARNWRALADGMRRFIDHPKLIKSMGDASLTRARSLFDAHHVAESIVASIVEHT